MKKYLLEIALALVLGFTTIHSTFADDQYLATQIIKTAKDYTEFFFFMIKQDDQSQVIKCKYAGYLEMALIILVDLSLMEENSPATAALADLESKYSSYFLEKGDTLARTVLRYSEKYCR